MRTDYSKISSGLQNLKHLIKEPVRPCTVFHRKQANCPVKLRGETRIRGYIASLKGVSGIPLTIQFYLALRNIEPQISYIFNSQKTRGVGTPTSKVNYTRVKSDSVRQIKLTGLFFGRPILIDPVGFAPIALVISDRAIKALHRELQSFKVLRHLLVIFINSIDKVPALSFTIHSMNPLGFSGQLKR